MLREMSTRFGRTPGGYIWILLQPLGMVILLAVGFSLLQRTPSLGTSFILFKATGFLLVGQFRTISQMVGMSLHFSRGLLDYPGVVWIDAVLARFLLNALAGTLVTFIILAGVLAWEGLLPVLRWPPIILSVVLALLLGLGVGCLNCVLFLRFEIWQPAWAILTAPLFIVSGVIFVFEDLPRLGQEILWYNPLYHITGLMRQGFYPIYNPIYISVTYVLACALIPLVMGLLLLRRFHRVLLER